MYACSSAMLCCGCFLCCCGLGAPAIKGIMSKTARNTKMAQAQVEHVPAPAVNGPMLR
jgi:hypothetical protein